MTGTVQSPDRELPLLQSMLAVAIVATPAYGLLRPVDDMWLRLAFSAGCALFVLGSLLSERIARHVRRVVVVLLLALAVWAVLGASIDGFDIHAAIALLLLQGCGAIVLRQPIEPVLFHGTLVGCTAACWAAGVPFAASPLFLVGTMTIAAAFGTVASLQRFKTLGQLVDRERELDSARLELERRVTERTAQYERGMQALRREVEERRNAEARAEAASVAKSTFLANMSHELRTPLNAIIGYAELLREDLVHAPELRSDVDRVVLAARQLLDMINDILDLAKIEAGRMELHLETVRLEKVVQQAVATVDPLARKKRNVIEMNVPTGPTEIVTDPTRLTQVLVNLLSNAVKFTEAGRIEIRARRVRTTTGLQLHVEVLDEGIGIPPDRMSQLFQKFSQIDASPTRRHSGTGLGLAICREFCQLLGGDVSAHSAVGEGSVFTVRIPWQEPARAALEHYGR
jgi:signal transduction histidine kinase